jgi:putative membrane protein
MLDADEQSKVTAAIGEAERHTGGEIVVVVAKASANYWPYRLAAAGLAALAAPLPLLFATRLSAERIYLIALVVFVVAALIMMWRPLWSLIVPTSTQRALADEAAYAQFYLRDVTKTRSRAGVLIFCSVAERHARVIADQTVVERVPDERWAEAVNALCEEAARGRLCDGCLAAVRICGEILADAIPRSADDVNERPDAVYTV